MTFTALKKAIFKSLTKNWKRNHHLRDDIADYSENMVNMHNNSTRTLINGASSLSLTPNLRKVNALACQFSEKFCQSLYWDLSQFMKSAEVVARRDLDDTQCEIDQ